MPTRYPLLSIGAKRRLELFRKEAALPKWARPMTWRDVRFATLKSASGLSEGANDGERVWTTFDGPQFRNEKYADECADIGRSIDHTGWYTCSAEDFTGEKARGIVARLPHGRFLAGYEWSGNGERVWFAGLHDSERDAALMADEHARVFADEEREYNERVSEARRISEQNDDRLNRLRECLALRNNACFTRLRDEAHELMSAIRTARETLSTQYADVEF